MYKAVDNLGPMLFLAALPVTLHKIAQKRSAFVH